MSDVRYLWADDQTWGGAVHKLIVLYVARHMSHPGNLAYGLTVEGMAAYAETTPKNAARVLRSLEVAGHLVQAYGREGLGWTLGAAHRREPFSINFGAA